MLPSNRPPTKLPAPTHPLEIRTVSDFLTLITHHEVPRVVRTTQTTYCSTVLGAGSQFTVYDEDGAEADEEPTAVKTITLTGAENQRKASELYKELKTLCALRDNPHVIKLLAYDLIEGRGSPDHHTPAIILLGAQFMLSDFSRLELDIEEKYSIILDVTNGLAAMHSEGIIHGDVKADNILIRYGEVGVDASEPYFAKISDFGSSIFLDSLSTNRPTRYYGTDITNAPETQDQSRNPIKPEMLGRCDIYSLGLLLLHVLAEELRACWSAKDESVLQSGIDFIQANEDIPEERKAVLELACRQLLPYKPEERCSDLSVVESILEADSDMSPPPPPKVGRTRKEIDCGLRTYFNDAHYVTFGWPDEDEIPLDVQQQIIKDLTKSTHGPSRGYAFFQLAIAHSLGLGGPKDICGMLFAAVQSAKADYLPAQAAVHAWHTAHNHPLDADEDLQLDWLYEAVARGSWTAEKTLQGMDTDLYIQARQDFHTRGGFNQYFYPNQPPACIGSSESIGDRDDVDDLMLNAAIYGDKRLMEACLTAGGNPNASNEFGESLLLLCCKGGHLDVMETLIASGASARTLDTNGVKIRGPAIHWIISFDRAHISRATDLLLLAGGRLDDDMDWNHPCIELHGRFPLGGPLMYALRAYNLTAVKSLLQHADAVGDVFSFQGSSGSLPVEYAVEQQSLEILHELEGFGAFEHSDWLGAAVWGLAMVPQYQMDAINGFLGAQAGQSTLATIDFIAQKMPDLLRGDPEGEYTPITAAAGTHNETVVRALLRHGCSVNVISMGDGRTPLNRWARRSLSCNNTIGVDLIAAGADVDLRNAYGKTPLHIAVQNNNTCAAAQLLKLGADIEATDISALTPLFSAALRGALKTGQLLLAWGANFHATNNWWQIPTEVMWGELTPAAFAASGRQEAFLNLLLEYDKNLIARPVSGDTLLHFAISEPETELLEFLLEFVQRAGPKLSEGVYVDAVNAGGWTALQLAAGNIRRQNHCGCLIRAGADVNRLSSSGHTVWDVAKQTRERVKDGTAREPPSVKERIVPLPAEYIRASGGAEERRAHNRNDGRIVDADRQEQLEIFDQLIQLIESNSGRGARDEAVDEEEFSLWRRMEPATEDSLTRMVRENFTGA